MELTKAFEMSIEYLGHADPIRVDKNGYICLTDMVKFFPRKRINNWMRLEATSEFLEVVQRFLNSSHLSYLKTIYRKRGKYEGGTYAHELVALEFATWLSPEFKMKVLYEYQNGTQKKEGWNIKRILSAFNYKLMSKAIQSAHEDPKHYHYSNEAKMINTIVFGHHEKGIRDHSSEEQLNMVAELEGHNATLIEIGMDYSERKEKLSTLFTKSYGEKEVIKGLNG